MTALNHTATARASQLAAASGLHTLVDIVLADPGLQRRVPEAEIKAGAESAEAMNGILVEAILATGVAANGVLTAADIRDVNSFIRANYADEWAILHGDDANNGTETGFHLVQADGATTQLFGKNAVNAVADGIYHLGFEIDGNRLLNEDGNANANVTTVAGWLNSLLRDDLADGSLVDASVASPYFTPTTGTGLDQLVQIITQDSGLNRKISTTEINTGAANADAMNAIIVEAIGKTGVAVDGILDPADVRELNAHIRANHAATWERLHGDDENNSETGFHLVQNDGATTQLFGKNAVNLVADSLYHLRFELVGNRFLNEDGNKNIGIFGVTDWLNRLLKPDLADGSLVDAGGKDPTFVPSTGTGLDRLVQIIVDDAGLKQRISVSDIKEGAKNADALNALLVEAIKNAGVAHDGVLTVHDMDDINHAIRATSLAAWTKYHGDDAGNGTETGFHLVQADGATTQLFGKNAVNSVADGIYHVGFEIEGGAFVNEDGNRNVGRATVADWLNRLLAEDLADGSLTEPATAPDPESIVYALPRPIQVSAPGDQVEVDHFAALALKEGAFEFVFTADTPADGTDVDIIFSKDAKGFGDGGHITTLIKAGRLLVALETNNDTVYLQTDAGAIRAGKEYHATFTFGGAGAYLYLNGVKIDAERDFTGGIAANTEDLAIGIGTKPRTPEHPDWRNAPFDGEIAKFTIYNEQLTNSDVAFLGRDFDGPFDPAGGDYGLIA